VSGTQLFYTTSGGIYRGSTSGVDAPVLLTNAGGSNKFAVAVDDTYVYWAGGSDGNVYRTPKNAAAGTAPTTVIDTTCSHLATLALDANNVYAGCFPTGRVVKAAKTDIGSAGTQYDTGHVGVMVGYVREDFVYFGYETGQGKSGVYKVSALLAGPVFNVYDTAPSTQGFDALVHDGTNVYWTDAYGVDLMRARPDGRSRTVIRASQTPGDLAAGLAVTPTDPYAYVSLLGSTTIVKIAK
jgi:hypothetical protein